MLVHAPVYYASSPTPFLKNKREFFASSSSKFILVTGYRVGSNDGEERAVIQGAVVKGGISGK